MSDQEVARDFDAERRERFEKPRTFRIAGEVFTFQRGLRPEDFAEIASPYFDLTVDSPPDVALEVLDNAIVGFLEGEDAEARWRKARARKDEPITARDMRNVWMHILQEQTGVPTSQPGPSLNGAGADDESSTESSSSEAGASAAPAA